jgi:hypothetical protein
MKWSCYGRLWVTIVKTEGRSRPLNRERTGLASECVPPGAGVNELTHSNFYSTQSPKYLSNLPPSSAALQYTHCKHQEDGGGGG